MYLRQICVVSWAQLALVLGQEWNQEVISNLWHPHPNPGQYTTIHTQFKRDFPIKHPFLRPLPVDAVFEPEHLRHLSRNIVKNEKRKRQVVTSECASSATESTSAVRWIPKSTADSSILSSSVLSAVDTKSFWVSQSTTAPSSETAETQTGAISSSSLASPRAPTNSRKMISSGFYPVWDQQLLPPSLIDMSKFDILFIAFAIPSATFDLYWDSGDGARLSRQVVSLAHAAGVKVVLSVGGWSGSQYFSKAVATLSSRTQFVKNILAWVNNYGFDGVDIDWEYPAANYLSNSWSNSDSSNYLLFLQQLRDALGTDKIISAATTQQPWLDSQGSPLTDVSEFAKLMDYIFLMNYDVWGLTTPPGANAPLSDGCGNSQQPLANAKAGIESWSKAGFPAEKIILGLPTYGYVIKSTSSLINHKRKTDEPLELLPVKAAIDPLAGSIDWAQLSIIGNPHLKRQSVSISSLVGQQAYFSTLVRAGVLVAQTDGSYAGAGGFTRKWDDCSNTPFISSSELGIVISYDDAQSLQLKGELAKQYGIAGCGVWTISGDTTNWALIDGYRQGMGLP